MIYNSDEDYMNAVSGLEDRYEQYIVAGDNNTLQLKLSREEVEKIMEKDPNSNFAALAQLIKSGKIYDFKGIDRETELSFYYTSSRSYAGSFREIRDEWFGGQGLYYGMFVCDNPANEYGLYFTKTGVNELYYDKTNLYKNSASALYHEIIHAALYDKGKNPGHSANHYEIFEGAENNAK